MGGTMSSADHSSMRCCQVALSTADLTQSLGWYQRVLGFVTAGTRRHCEGPMFAAVPGLPEASFDVSCLVGGQSFAQIEMFQFARPTSRALPRHWRACDIGFSTVVVAVDDIDGVLERLAGIGQRAITPPLGNRGSRRVCVRDPDGILIELTENGDRSPSDGRSSDRNELPRIVGVTLSVSSLDNVRRFWVDVVGGEEVADGALHGPEHEALWGLTGAVCRRLLVRSGDFALEFAEYSSPAPRPPPDEYRISDHGILNVAIGSTDKLAFDALYDRAARAGFRGHTEPWTVPGVATVVYMRDAEGFSVELLHVPPSALGRMGFVANEERDEAVEASRSLVGA